MFSFKVFSRVVFPLLCSCVVLSCYEEQEIPVTVDFDYVVPEAGYTVPVIVGLTNNTSGADFYQWTFEGASPATSDKKHPGPVTYSQAGSYKIILEAWNDTQRNKKEITIQLDSAVSIDFDYTIDINHFAPATVHIDNQTRGASTYSWTFEGGSPATSSEQFPPEVHFSTAGDHQVTLTVTNGRETFSISKTVTLQPAMSADFNIVPSFEDQDMEAPLNAALENLTTSGLGYSWSSTGGVISDPSAENPQIFFDAPGDYTVTLQAENGKEVQTVHRTISVKANSNLFTMTDVKLGISAAHASIGCFYSAALKRTLTKDEVTAENGELIDFAFFGINSGFSYCRIISPDSAAKFGFPAIPGARHSAIINTMENSGLSFTADEFDAMTNDAPLIDLDISGNDSETAFFNSTVTPRVVLFETQDGRKGAISIKAFVANGSASYILADIKVQKE